MIQMNPEPPIARHRAQPFDLQINGRIKAPLTSKDQWALPGPLPCLVNGINGSTVCLAAPNALPIDSPEGPYRAAEYLIYTAHRLRIRSAGGGASARPFAGSIY